MSMGLNLIVVHLFLHRVTDSERGLGPDLDLLLATLLVGDDAAVELHLDLLGLVLELLEQRRLDLRRPHVGDRDRERGAGRVLEAELLQLVETLGHHRTRVAARPACSPAP